MATTMTRRRLTPSQERIWVEEMDSARIMAEQADRMHDRMAYELGYERVRINHVEMGDALRHYERGQAAYRTVEKIEHRHDEVSSWFAVLYQCEEHGSVVMTYDDGEFVSRRLPETDEPF